MGKVRVRMDYLDVAKCIAIICVVMGHAYHSLDSVPYYSSILYTFHMPLFFMVSGIVVRRHRHAYDLNHWRRFFQKNILSIFIPYFIWALIYADFSFPNILTILYGSREALKSVHSLTALWFLPCLFVARTFVELILWLSTCFKKADRHLFALCMSVPMFAIGLALPDLSMNMGWPWCLKSAFVATGFMLIGYAFKERLLLAQDKPYKVHFAWMAGYLALYLAVVLPRGNDIPFLGMYIASYPDPLFMFMSSFPAIGFVLALSIVIVKAFSGTKFVEHALWMGQSTLGIFVLHMFFLQQVVMPLIDKTPINEPSFLYCIICSAITLVYCVIMVKLIDRYIPQLLGKFRTPKTVELKLEDVTGGEESDKPEGNEKEV